MLRALMAGIGLHLYAAVYLGRIEKEDAILVGRVEFHLTIWQGLVEHQNKTE